ncbi:Ig-like domain-containing protein [Staphylococcus caeli]|uniref:Cell wall associated biofilm protein n=1 Tax=Staphylococcus caeli TaxID=2201815 RepID=A0A1D4RPI6_9STAP|nr:Ig-like domain-containing protein [Staphylococcus caeli]SCS69107.1 cell wall associated biofilm protein [Staphylococcus caeli]SCT49358.1 cell wall associated biofilm protein [Staphylococcus caeli]
MKEKLIEFSLFGKKNVLIQCFMLILFMFVFTNKYNAIASENEQNKEVDLEKQTASNRVERVTENEQSPSEKSLNDSQYKQVKNSTQNAEISNIGLKDNVSSSGEKVKQQKIDSKNISAQNEHSTTINTMTTNSKVKDNVGNSESSSINPNTLANKNSVIPTSTSKMQAINKYEKENISTNTEVEKLVKEQKQRNDSKLKNIKGNNSFKETYRDQQYVGILSIETDRTNYKPGDTVKIYTEYNKNFVKPVYSEAIIYSHRSSGWFIDDPPYLFEQTSLVGRTTSFYKKPNGNWESIISIQLPKNMVDDAFNITVNSWNDSQDKYTQSFGGLYNDLIIKVMNDSTTSTLGGYKVEAFDQSTISKEEHEGPKFIKYTTDKKIYNPKDIVKITIEMQDENDIAYVQAKLKTLEPNDYKDGSQKYIPMNFANFTRNVNQLSNGNWQAIIEFEIPSYIKTGDIILDDLLSSDNLGNDNKIDYDFEKKLFRVERTENIEKFTADSVADFSKEIRGKATSNMTIYAYVNNKQIGKAEVIDGKYFMKIPKQSAGTNIQIFTKNKYNNKSKVITVRVIDRTAPMVPTANKLTPKSKIISGKSEKYSTLYVYRGTTKIGQVKVDSKGNYKLNIKAQKKGAKLTLYAMDAAKNKSKKIYIKVN